MGSTNFMPSGKKENSGEKLYPSLSELATGNMDPNTMRSINEDRERTAQKMLELEGAMGQMTQGLKRLESKVLTYEANGKKIPAVAPIILMEDNLTKAKRAIMVEKVMCPTQEAMQAMLSIPTQSATDMEKIAKAEETIIRKNREYVNTFPKFNGESRKGQEWCAQICFHAKQYRVETIPADEVKFAIFGSVEGKMKNRILHLEPGTQGYNCFTAAEYLEEMIGRFMNARTKGGAKEEFENKKQGINEDALEYYDTKLQLYLHAYDEGERNIQEFKRLTLNGLKNVGMIQQCWNVLSKRTDDWTDIRMAIEDQLTVQRNWNLHPSNPNQDMTGLKDAYQSREDNHLGLTGQVRMEVNAVTNPAAYTPVIPTAAGNQIIVIDELADKINHLGNCYGCNKPGHVLRDCAEKNGSRYTPRNNYNKGPRRDSRDIKCYNCNKTGHYSRDCRGPRKDSRQDETPQDREASMKKVREIMAKNNLKPEDFQ